MKLIKNKVVNYKTLIMSHETIQQDEVKKIEPSWKLCLWESLLSNFFQDCVPEDEVGTLSSLLSICVVSQSRQGHINSLHPQFDFIWFSLIFSTLETSHLHHQAARRPGSCSPCPPLPVTSTWVYCPSISVVPAMLIQLCNYLHSATFAATSTNVLTLILQYSHFFSALFQSSAILN